MNKPATMVGFNPKKSGKRKQVPDPERTRQDMLENEDSSALEVDTDAEEDDVPPFTQTPNPPPKKVKKSQEMAIEGNNFCLEHEDETEDAEKPEILPISFGPNLEVTYYKGDSSFMKNTIVLKRLYIDSKGKEREFCFNLPKQHSWGLTAALMKLMLRDPEVMAIGKMDKHAVPRLKHYFMALRK